MTCLTLATAAVPDTAQAPLLQRLRQRWLQSQRQRQDAQALAQMDGRELNDLALGRGEVPYWLAQTERD